MRKITQFLLMGAYVFIALTAAALLWRGGAGWGAGTQWNLTPDKLVCNADVSLAGIGREAASQIWDRALTLYMTSGTTYANARVATMNAQTTLDVCYQLLDANSEPCRAITRLGDGQIFEVRASNSNIGSLSVEGVDLTMDYTVGLPDGMAIGEGKPELGLMLNTGWLFERESQIIGAQPIDCAGFFGSCTAQGAGGSPDFKALLTAKFDSGPLAVRAQVRHLAGLEPLATIAATTSTCKGWVRVISHLPVWQSRRRSLASMRRARRESVDASRRALTRAPDPSLSRAQEVPGRPPRAPGQGARRAPAARRSALERTPSESERDLASARCNACRRVA